MVAPFADWTTIWSPSPDAAGKFAASRVAEDCESVPGRLKLELKLLPATLLSPATTVTSRPAASVDAAGVAALS
jgi:hypothetical protein